MVYQVWYEGQAMGTEVNFHDAMEWLEEAYEEADSLEEQKIVEWIQEMIWRYEDMRNS